MPYTDSTGWQVVISKRAAKRATKLPRKVLKIFEELLLDLARIGPIQPEWPNYSRLLEARYHCHLNYHFVAVWEVVDNEIRILEVTYVGSREDAPY